MIEEREVESGQRSGRGVSATGFPFGRGEDFGATSLCWSRRVAGILEGESEREERGDIEREKGADGAGGRSVQKDTE